ncbi:selenide, water dikinase SelD [Adhaeribacter radiodurans]|uniref:Selenide, water dikinase n=1 Tax=Adhaeribacter radiodurans TaxID=2745197 RepID=A0A7L7L2J4_9BACT|nr:selenide, water dikinase SelD [Adhaeribacter radiodurans]QMU26983.1 selenide, water dikinase SelD [Adhaeribacter radiodurans]
MQNIKLTQYSHGAGCGCKIAPKVLDTILHTTFQAPEDKNLLVGNSSRDDAAVYALGDGTAIISTTDFFMPIVDDAFDFGKIASANAISDVYAMGGKPLMAIAVLGWSVNTLPAEVAQRVIDGSRAICHEAGIPLAGGHSIDSPEPIFGLAVTGLVNIENLKQNNTATAGCELYLTKPLGVGILTTAQKKGILKPEHASTAPLQMMQLNIIGTELGKLPGVKALTDVTGFGLLGHLSEVCEGSGLQATIQFSEVPRLPQLDDYLAQKSVPGGTTRNWDSYGHKISALTDYQRAILCDPQTSGGLLVAVDPASREEVQAVFQSYGLDLKSFGYLHVPDDSGTVINVE